MREEQALKKLALGRIDAFASDIIVGYAYTSKLIRPELKNMIVDHPKPVDIALGPLTDILAAGNRVIIKPSEITPACSALLDELVSKTFEPEFVAVINGDLQVSQAFSQLAWDHLIFTGDPDIGKKLCKPQVKIWCR